MEDTDPRVRALQIERIRKMEPWERLRAMCGLIQSIERVVTNEVRRRNPGMSEEDVHIRVAARRLPPELVLRAYGYDPRRDGYG